MVGRVDVRRDGRPMTVEAAGDAVTVRVGSLRDAWRGRRALLARALPLLRRAGLTLDLRVGDGRRAVRLWPRPRPWIRWLLSLPR